jgi:hypothetical protein
VVSTGLILHLELMDSSNKTLSQVPVWPVLDLWQSYLSVVRLSPFSEKEDVHLRSGLVCFECWCSSPPTPGIKNRNLLLTLRVNFLHGCPEDHLRLVS